MFFFKSIGITTIDNKEHKQSTTFTKGKYEKASINSDIFVQATTAIKSPILFTPKYEKVIICITCVNNNAGSKLNISKLRHTGGGG